jgi:NADP-dependent 3-hydroxy acid dehydrogenase YdfG
MKKLKFFENVVIITGALSGIVRQLALRPAEQGAWLSKVWNMVKIDCAKSG